MPLRGLFAETNRDRAAPTAQHAVGQGAAPVSQTLPHSGLDHAQ